MTKILYQGHGSLRIVTPENKIVYVDPYAGNGYDLPADLILVTHQHSDHNHVELISKKNPDCVIITEKESLENGKHQSFDLGYINIEATEALNENHDPAECVGYILSFSDGSLLYIAGDTSMTPQMKALAERKLDCAFFPCDGMRNMDAEEASKCAALVSSRLSVPYHMTFGDMFDHVVAEKFKADGRLIVTNGEEIVLSHTIA